MSPFDTRITSLTTPQMAWILSNHYKDQEEDFLKTKYILYFLNPEAAAKLFGDGKEGVEVQADEEEFLKEVREHTSANVTLEDLDQAFDKSEQGLAIQDLDTIKRTEE